jgi:hypothetical protein
LVAEVRESLSVNKWVTQILDMKRLSLKKLIKIEGTEQTEVKFQVGSQV